MIVVYNEECYRYLKEKGYLKKYAMYCHIGFSCAYIVACLIVLFIIIRRGSFSTEVPVCDFIGLLLLNGYTYYKLNKKAPYLCRYAEIKVINENKARLTIGDIEKNAVSFEGFLRNENLSGYKAGDKVIVYSPDEGMKRPMFTKEG